MKDNYVFVGLLSSRFYFHKSKLFSNIYGAFVEIEPGIDGLIHISDLSWTKKFNHPGEALQKSQEVKAVVQLAQGVEDSNATAEELLAYTREHIAHFKCPRSVDFMDELPRLPTGKLYKRLIKDAYWGKTDSKIV